MAQVIMRNLADSVVESLKLRAALHNRSLEKELCEILTEAARPTIAERVAVCDRIRAMTPKGVAQTDSAETIRAHRDAHQ